MAPSPTPARVPAEAAAGHPYSRLWSADRLGQQSPGDAFRHVFTRDFDRIVFSSAFRRMQNKTQVFPLPGSTFVHNRLTHSLEVASVGRSLGQMVGLGIVERFGSGLTDDDREFYGHQLSAVIAAACLAHDIGNPPFGHSGESALSRYFAKGPGQSLIADLPAEERADLTAHEGNASGLRILTASLPGRQPGGLSLTKSTLAATLKYPCASIQQDKRQLHRKKYGYFATEVHTFTEVAQATGAHRDHSVETAGLPAYRRHPFVFLTEAADDICYRVMDLEDAHRLGIIPYGTVCELLLGIARSGGANSPDRLARLETTLRDDKMDEGERVAHLRAMAINSLIHQTADAYRTHEPALLEGTHPLSLIDSIAGSAKDFLIALERLSIDRIYAHRSVVELELAGYEILGGLLDRLAPAVLMGDEARDLEAKLVGLLPVQFRYTEALLQEDKYRQGVSPTYLRLRGLVDYLSGMTDNYAVDLYRKISGIELIRFGY